MHRGVFSDCRKSLSVQLKKQDRFFQAHCALAEVQAAHLSLDTVKHLSDSLCSHPHDPALWSAFL